MANNFYKAGRRKEYKIVEDFRKDGFEIVERTAGSHSEIDIIAIDLKNKKINLIQSKRSMNHDMSYIDPKLKEKIEEKNKELNGLFTVCFEVL